MQFDIFLNTNKKKEYNNIKKGWIISSNIQSSFDFNVQENTMTKRMNYDNKAKNGLKVGGLFAGIGGIELGFKKVGFEISWANEIDKYDAITYIKN